MSSDSGSDSSLTGVEIGFVKDVRDDWRMHRCYFPSKVGQKPAWLNPEIIPSLEDLQCSKCQQPCIFLLQLYAPDDSDPMAFHRTIFVFCCKNPTCYESASSDCFKVFRCQLEKDNKYYQSEPPDYEDPTFHGKVAEFAETCAVCGCKAPKFCSRCSSVHYCSKQHQILDWKKHKISCGKTDSDKNQKLDQNGASFLFPEKEISIEDEELGASSESTSQNYELENLDRKSLSPTELEQFVNNEQDEQFSIFQERISHFPEQIIRYDKGGEPLLCSNVNTIRTEEVPKCSCGAERQFEFQIMPQLLNYLSIQTKLEGPSIDWGVLSIYTCSRNCRNESKPYITEFLHKQDFSG